MVTGPGIDDPCPVVEPAFQRGVSRCLNSSGTDFRTHPRLMMVLVSEFCQIHCHMKFVPSYTAPQRETVKRILLEVRRLVSILQSFNQAAVSSSKALPNYLPIWALSFWDCLSEACDTCLSWSLDWVNTLCSTPSQSASCLGVGSSVPTGSLVRLPCWEASRRLS